MSISKTFPVFLGIFIFCKNKIQRKRYIRLQSNEFPLYIFLIKIRKSDFFIDRRKF